MTQRAQEMRRWLVEYHAALVESVDLPGPSRWLADVAAHRADNKTGAVWLANSLGMSARAVLACWAGYSEAWVKRHLPVLVDGGWLWREDQRQGSSYFDLWVVDRGEVLRLVETGMTYQEAAKNAVETAPQRAGQRDPKPSGQNGSPAGQNGGPAGQNGGPAGQRDPHVFSGVFSDDCSSSVARDARGGAGAVEQSSPSTLVEWDQRFRGRLRGPHRTGHVAYPLSPEKAYNRLVKRHGFVPASFSSQEWEALMVCASLLTERSHIVERARLLLAEQGTNGQ